MKLMKSINVTLQISAEDEDRFIKTIAQGIGEHLGTSAYDPPVEIVNEESTATEEHDSFVMEVRVRSARREIAARILGNGTQVLVMSIVLLGLERVFEAQEEIRELGDKPKLPDVVRRGNPRVNTSTDYEQFGEYFIVTTGTNPKKRDYLARVGEKIGVSLTEICTEN